MKTLTLPAKMGNLETLIGFVLSAAEQLNFDPKLQNQLRLATEEILVNVISYAYPGQNGDVTLSTDQTSGREGVRVEIIDAGTPFDPLSKPAPDLTVPIKDRQIGGLGIFLLREIMSEVSYRRENGRNILTFIKYRGQEAL
jgi:anti-sigma regulatory factor (Ser/Thr protein kinase)